MLVFVHPSRFQDGPLYSPEMYLIHPHSFLIRFDNHIHTAALIVEAELLTDTDTISCMSFYHC